MTFVGFYTLILDHFKENLTVYAIIGVFMVPIIIFTRKWSLPLIFYTIETLIYITAMHIIVHLFVILVVWFKVNTSMKMLRENGIPADVPDWKTPLYDFWNSTAYSPHWIVYVEVAFVVIIALLVIRFRPPALGPVKSRRAKKQKKEQSTARKEFEEKKAKYIDDIMH